MLHNHHNVHQCNSPVFPSLHGCIVVQGGHCAQGDIMSRPPVAVNVPRRILCGSNKKGPNFNTMFVFSGGQGALN